MRWRAWARQTLGLSLSEFERLTPAEIEAETKVAEERRESERGERELLARIIDTHFATVELLLHNANFKHPAKLSDFKLLRDPKRDISPQLLAFDAKLRAESQARLASKEKQK